MDQVTFRVPALGAVTQVSIKDMAHAIATMMLLHVPSGNILLMAAVSSALGSRPMLCTQQPEEHLQAAVRGCAMQAMFKSERLTA